MYMFIFSKLKFLVLFVVLSLQAQTLVNPNQIRNWKQISPIEIGGPDFSGTRMMLSQTKISPIFLVSWRDTVSSSRGESYGIAISTQQTDPILLCCGLPPYNPANFGILWFVSK